MTSLHYTLFLTIFFFFHRWTADGCTLIHFFCAFFTIDFAAGFSFLRYWFNPNLWRALIIWFFGSLFKRLWNFYIPSQKDLSDEFNIWRSILNDSSRFSIANSFTSAEESGTWFGESGARLEPGIGSVSETLGFSLTEKHFAARTTSLTKLYAISFPRYTFSRTYSTSASSTAITLTPGREHGLWWPTNHPIGDQTHAPTGPFPSAVKAKCSKPSWLSGQWSGLRTARGRHIAKCRKGIRQSLAQQLTLRTGTHARTRFAVQMDFQLSTGYDS